jgi:hypothetical protein
LSWLGILVREQKSPGGQHSFNLFAVGLPLRPERKIDALFELLTSTVDGLVEGCLTRQGHFQMSAPRGPAPPGLDGSGPLD